MSRQTAFGKLLLRSVTELWIHARSVAVAKMIFLTFFWGVLLATTNVAISLVGYTTQAAPFIQLGVLVFFLLMTATWIVLSYEQTTTEFGVDQKPREIIAGVLAILPTFLIGAMLTWASVSYTFYILQQPLHITVIDYATCEKAGGVILQTSPRQCVTTSNTYTEGE